MNEWNDGDSVASVDIFSRVYNIRYHPGMHVIFILLNQTLLKRVFITTANRRVLIVALCKQQQKNPTNCGKFITKFDSSAWEPSELRAG